MVKSNRFIESRIMWKIRGYQLSPNLSTDYKNLPQSKKDYFENHIRSLDIGKPVLLIQRKKGDCWTIIGTQKIVWYSSKKIGVLNYSSIKFIGTEDAYKLIYQKETERNLTNKLEWDELTLLDTENKVHKIPSNKGSDFFALWNILIMLSNLFKNNEL